MQGMLTRGEMEAVIDGGGSVVHRGRLISVKADLPSETELAAGDHERMAAVRRGLEAQQAAIASELAELDRPGIAQPQPVLSREEEQRQAVGDNPPDDEAADKEDAGTDAEKRAEERRARRAAAKEEKE